MNTLLRFKMSDSLIVGNGAIQQLPEVVASLGKKALIVTDPGLVKAGICAGIEAVLSQQGIEFDVFDRVEPDPRIEIVFDCVETTKQTHADVLIGLGGGSSMDIAKVAAILVTHSDDISTYFGIGNIPSPGLPTIMIPTTSGTGSEVTPIAVLSDKKEQLKKGIVSDYLFTRAAVVDPELTYGLPPYITAFTGMDALTHAIEAYTNKHAHPFIDTFALESVRLIGQSLLTAVTDGTHQQARYEMALGSLYGGLCLGSVNTAAVHALAYPLGGTFDIPHGVANSLLLPYVMKFNVPANTEKYAAVAQALGCDISSKTPQEAALMAVSKVEELSKACGIVSRMSELNIPESAIPEMAVAAMKVTRLLNNNPREVTVQDAEAIYRQAY